MRYTGPKNRIARRENTDLGLKTPGTKSHARLLKKLNVFPGQHGTKSRRKTSERGRQIRESQKLRFLFGLTASQLKNYFRRAVKKTGNTALHLSQFLERRLDNSVYRLGLAPTRAAARQLVTHKHVKVNGKIVSIPSYQMRVDDTISLNAKAEKIPAVEKVATEKDIYMAKWLERKGTVGRITTEPDNELIDKQINLRLVIEYFSR